MGSATVSNAKPQIPMAESDKKTFKKLLKVFFKKDKKKEKIVTNEPVDVIDVSKQNSIATLAVENVLQKIEKLKIQDKEDELQNFTFKTIKEECRNDRSDSHSSEDSGFAEKLSPDEEASSDVEDKHDDVIEGLEKLNLSEKDDERSLKDKERRVQTVVVSRRPIRPKVGTYSTAPYYVKQTEPCRQIQINKHTLTGGQVIVNRGSEFLEVDAALKHVQQTSTHSQHEDQDEWFSIISEVIQEDSGQGRSQDASSIATDLLRKKESGDSVEDIFPEFFQSEHLQQEFYQTPSEDMARDPEPVMTPPHQEQTDMLYQSQPNPIEEFSKLNYEFFGELDLNSLNALVDMPPKSPAQHFIFPTPPHSENAASPMSDSQGSYRASDYTYSPGRSGILSSPERSSPICNSDYEKFQEISPHYEEPSISPISLDEEKKRERINSTSSMTMKQYKDLQKEISHSFSKMECCQLTRKSCKQIFQEHLQKVSVEDRRGICLKVAKMDLKHAYGVLQNIIKSLSASSSLEDLHHALFCLICERVLAQKPAWYVEDFGLNLLKSAALRCPGRPLLTRYLVQCVRAALRVDPSLVQGKESVFHEVDAAGDTLVTALARRGDAGAGALAELLRREPADVPLFRLHHLNADGASALHVACCEHSAAEPRLHVAHVLLEHGHADLWQGDAKAGDTPVHMAVNARACDLRLVLVLFRQLDRKLWKKLAHAPNTCSTTPLEYARSATKSQVRDGYPAEVLEFLKKCR